MLSDRADFVVEMDVRFAVAALPIHVDAGVDAAGRIRYEQLGLLLADDVRLTRRHVTAVVEPHDALAGASAGTAAGRLANQDRKPTSCSEAIERGVSGEAECGGQNQHSGSAERPRRAALPPQRGQRDFRLTRRGTTARLSGQGEAQNGNSGLYWFRINDDCGVFDGCSPARPLHL